eukprot:TRINITY_DN69_c0_g1_i4.p1 TRINITY_DN69_c0_g1~~TRINITY_DN69_c0_g1_i4.p1  ORF type:complete len:213 (-),score=85.64 TRINITY_DN69_c0_g1_i4:1435-2073(-)
MSEEFELNADLMEGGEADITLESNEELELIKARLMEMEAEAEKLKRIQSEADKKMSIDFASQGAGSSAAHAQLSYEEKVQVDARSVYVGNVDYGSTAEELEQHFHGCGSINRVTILCNKYDCHPKGFAYVEFTENVSVVTAMALDDSLFRGRQIKVMPKRTNKPGLTSTNRRPFYGGGRKYMGASRGSRGAGRGRGAFGSSRRNGISYLFYN